MIQPEELGTNDDVRTRNLMTVLHGLRGSACRQCAVSLCQHESLMSIVLGLKDAPRCWNCLAQGLSRDRTELRDQVWDYVQSRPCFRSGWLTASEEEGFGSSTRPRCLWPDDDRPAVVARPSAPAVTAAAGLNAPPAAVDAEWNAGDLGCGDLVLELRFRMAPLRPGQILHVIATDPGAPADLPAWCKLTGHGLAFQRHPDYWIRRREQ